MYFLHVGTDGNAVKAGDLCCQKSALQAAVYDTDDGLSAGQLLINLRGKIAEVRFFDQFPGGIGSLDINRSIEFLRDAGDPVEHHLFLGIDAAAHHGMDADAVCHGLDDSHAEGGLGYILVEGGVLDHAVGEGHEEADHAAAVLASEGNVQSFSALVGPFCAHVDIGIRHAVFLCNVFGKGGDSLFDLTAAVFACENDLRPGLAGNGIVAVAAVETDDAELAFFFQPVEKAGHQEVRIGSAAVDLFTGMAAAETVDPDLQDLAVFLTAFSGQGADDFRAAGTGGCDHTFIFGIEIDHPAAL